MSLRAAQLATMAMSAIHTGLSSGNELDLGVLAGLTASLEYITTREPSDNEETAIRNLTDMLFTPPAAATPAAEAPPAVSSETNAGDGGPAPSEVPVQAPDGAVSAGDPGLVGDPATGADGEAPPAEVPPASADTGGPAPSTEPATDPLPDGEAGGAEPVDPLALA